MTGIHHGDVLQITSLPHNPLAPGFPHRACRRPGHGHAPLQAGGPWGFLAVSRDPLRLHPCSWWLPWPVPWMLGLSEDLLGCRRVRLPSALPAWTPHTAPETPDAGTRRWDTSPTLGAQGASGCVDHPSRAVALDRARHGDTFSSSHQPLNRVISPRCLPHTSQTFISSSTEA